MLQHHFTGVRTVSPTSGLDRVSTKQGLMCFAQGHNTVRPVRLESAALWSRVKHSTTEPLHSQCLSYLQHTIRLSTDQFIYLVCRSESTVNRRFNSCTPDKNI